MTNERDQDWMQPGVYDDDRLLACALGLDEDPELLEAAAGDAALAARLDAVRADVALIGAQVAAAVPEPDESYTDLSGERWSGLEEFFEAPAAPAPRRRRRWWQVVAPVAAVLVVALVVGIVAVQNGAHFGASGSSSATSSSGSAEVAQGDGGSSGAQSYGDTATKSAAAPPQTRSSLVERFRDQLDRFAVVVLARARKATGAIQRFAVLRIFKGSAPEVVELVVNDQPTDAGRLHVLMLDPTASPEAEPATDAATASPWPLTASPAPGAESPLPDTITPAPETASPVPIPSLAAGVLPGRELAVAYTYLGEPTAEWELAPGIDPDSVDITIP